MNSYLLFFYEFSIIISYLLFVLVDSAIRGIVGLFYGAKPESLNGKTVVLTGAAGGIGRCIGLALYKEGCNLALVDLNKPDTDRIVQEVRASQTNGCKVIGYNCDITNAQQVSQLFANVRRDFGRVHILINNAGVAVGKSFLDESFQEVQRTMNVNCLSHFLTTKEVLPHMISDGSGHIVSTASVMGLFGYGPHCTDYAASKFGAVGFMEALDYELHSKGIDSISFTTVCPYMVQTPLFAGAVPTRFPNYEPILTPEQVAESTVDGIKTKRRIVVIPNRFVTYVLCKLILPRSVCFRLLDFLETNISMVRFQGRQGVSNGH